MQKYTFFFSISLLIFLSFMSCEKQEKPINDDFSIATQDYAVLAEKAFSYQADFNMEGWGNMLADDVEYDFPEDGEIPQNHLVGKNALTSYWKNWQQSKCVSSLSFSGFNHFPLNSVKSLKVSGMAGVYVFSLFSSKMVLADGKISEQRLNVCCHFNNKKLIDRFYAYFDKMPLITQNKSQQ